VRHSRRRVYHAPVDNDLVRTQVRKLKYAAILAAIAGAVIALHNPSPECLPQAVITERLRHIMEQGYPFPRQVEALATVQRIKVCK
jgi:hypothetical protein